MTNEISKDKSIPLHIKQSTKWVEKYPLKKGICVAVKKS
jgi:hypothetical protein